MRPRRFPHPFPLPAILVAVALLSGAAGPAAAAFRSSRVHEFPVPTGGARPYTIVAGPDGNLWFTESNGNKIGRIKPDGSIKEFDLPNAGSEPYGITVGADGNLWFTERAGNAIGRMTTNGDFLPEFPVPTPGAQPWGITATADGSIWFTEENVDMIGQVSPLGFITEYPLTPGTFPTWIAAGPDGNVWFTEEIGNAIGRIRTAGEVHVKLFPVPTEQALPWDIAPGADGNMWFTELAGRNIGRITPSGVITEFPVPGDFSGISGIAPAFDGRLWFIENDTRLAGAITTAGHVVIPFDTGEQPNDIAAGPDGNLWFTEAASSSNAIGRIRNSHSGQAYVLSMNVAFAPTTVTVSLGTAVRWLFQGPGVHSVTDADTLGLFASVDKHVGSVFTQQFAWAGTFPYHDAADPDVDGRVVVAVEAPPTGTVGTAFQVRWAIGAPPSGFVYDVQRKRPGDTAWGFWRQGVVTSHEAFKPKEAGTYQFRARLRNTSLHSASGWSPPAAVIVS
jgi:virginiamycin B lyase